MVTNTDPTFCALSDMANPFNRPEFWRKKIVDNIKLIPKIQFNGKGFICALITSRCPVGCEHCMFFSNMAETKSSVNTMTPYRISNLMNLVRDSNTGYLLVSGGGEGFLEPALMNQIIQETTANVTWMVTSAYWAVDKNRAREVVHDMHDAFIRGKHKEHGRRICIRVSFDSFHINRLARINHNPFQYIMNLIEIFESEYAHESGFVLMLHGLEGEDVLIDNLCKTIHAEKLTRLSPSDGYVKVTESAILLKLPSGYEFEVTFAKLLLSELAPDLRNKKTLEKKIEVFERDAFRNERGNPAILYNPDGTIGTDMLVIYNGRVSGAWQSEMPDVPINIDSDDFQSIMQKTLSDPGVLGTIENGLAYRFDIISEVCPAAVLRCKAVNVRDYSSPILLEEDKIKLYYTIRALQDFVAQSRVTSEELNCWPIEIKSLVDMTKDELQNLYRSSRYDIIQQFIEKEDYFDAFIQRVKEYARERNPYVVREFFASHPSISKRTIDKWRLLLERIVYCWYDIYSFNEKELMYLPEIERILDEKILAGSRVYEGLSAPS